VQAISSRINQQSDFFIIMSSNSSIKILIVDDEPLIRQITSEVLKDDGHAVFEADSSEECLKVLSAEKVDIVLLDIQLPGQSGMDTLKQLITENYHAEVIMISGHGTIETAVQAIKYGASDFLEKPFSMARLKAALAVAIEKRKKTLQVEQIKGDGKLIGKYQVQEEIASGGTATVYRAIQQDLQRAVALKILHPHLTKEDTFTERFFREAKMMASLSHPHIIQVFDYGSQDGLYFLAMELVDGHSLDSYINAKNQLPLSVCAAVGIKIAKALEHAHGKSIVHRDIKPQNVLVSKEGVVKLVDFGLARCLYEEGRNLTRTDQLAGTPQFMSPEQIAGERPGPSTDIFSLGIVLYVITTLQFPFFGSNLGAIVKHIVEGSYVSPQALNPKIPDDFKKIISKCLETRIKDRYQSAAEISSDLERCLAAFDQKNKKRMMSIDGILEEYFSKNR
jgi:DNA-binding response OmpR family regulator